jgi:shikimate dehydrogenase
MPTIYGLIGRNIQYSKSKEYFEKKFRSLNINGVYEILDFKCLDEFLDYLHKNKSKKLGGFNITIPYKEEIIKHLDVLDDSAKNVNAVNCINIIDGVMIGYNTDIIGFESSIKPHIKSHHKKALIIGKGGASKAASYILDKFNIGYDKITREYVDNIDMYDIIINASPVGTHPRTDNPNIN